MHKIFSASEVTRALRSRLNSISDAGSVGRVVGELAGQCAHQKRLPLIRVEVSQPVTLRGAHELHTIEQNAQEPFVIREL